MIKTKTLFILGAGASAPFEYPTGVQLRNLICGQTRKEDVIQALVPVNEKEEKSFYAQSVDNFIREFSRSGLYSIDFFLENRKEFMNIGKMTIASYLLPLEKDERLRESGNNWYMYLYDRLKASFEKFNENEVSFVTFNYDRSLEQFLFEALKSQFNKTPQECTEKIKNIPIIHLYGQLDFLPWQSENGIPYLYQRDSIVRLRNARDGIKLITEEREVEKSQEFKAAYKLIEKAHRIYILGFGFDETNLDRLNVNLMKDKTITATAHALEKSKQRWVKEYFKSKIDSDIFLLELDTLSLLKEHLQIE